MSSQTHPETPQTGRIAGKPRRGGGASAPETGAEKAATPAVQTGSTSDTAEATLRRSASPVAGDRVSERGAPKQGGGRADPDSGTS